MSATMPRRRPGLAGWISIASLIVLGLGALAGGVALVARADGSIMGFDVSLLAGSPFPDFLVPGLILGGLFGIGSLVVALLGIRGAAVAPLLAVIIGLGQMIWIVVQLGIIKEFSWLHPTMFGIGLVIAVAAVPWGWASFHRFVTAHWGAGSAAA